MSVSHIPAAGPDLVAAERAGLQTMAAGVARRREAAAVRIVAEWLASDCAARAVEWLPATTIKQIAKWLSVPVRRLRETLPPGALQAVNPKAKKAQAWTIYLPALPPALQSLLIGASRQDSRTEA